MLLPKRLEANQKLSIIPRDDTMAGFPPNTRKVDHTTKTWQDDEGCICEDLAKNGNIIWKCHSKSVYEATKTHEETSRYDNWDDWHEDVESMDSTLTSFLCFSAFISSLEDVGKPSATTSSYIFIYRTIPKMIWYWPELKKAPWTLSKFSITSLLIFPSSWPWHVDESHSGQHCWHFYVRQGADDFFAISWLFICKISSYKILFLFESDLSALRLLFYHVSKICQAFCRNFYSFLFLCLFLLVLRGLLFFLKKYLYTWGIKALFTFSFIFFVKIFADFLHLISGNRLTYFSFLT